MLHIVYAKGRTLCNRGVGYTGGMKKIFVSFSWTDTEQQMVKSIVSTVADKLRVAGHDVYVNLEDKDVADDWQPGQYVAEAINKLKSCEVLLALKITKSRSEGQLMEIGAAIALGIPVVLCMQFEADEHTYLDDPNISNQVLMWEDTDDLLQKLGEITL